MLERPQDDSVSSPSDDKSRCPWPGKDPLYLAYHDEEWGVPEHDDRALFEKLMLDGFQAGLSWITVLRKREAFRAAFDHFDPERIARYDNAKIDALMQDKGIIRNRAKIESTISSARAWLKIQEGEVFSNYLWGFLDGRSVQNSYRDVSEIPAQTELSVKIAKGLKSRGFGFCGPTVVYAFCQATGMVNDHLVSCWRHAECRALQAAVRK
jgi:DNA-3-methyladenine glycosylase I